MLEKSFKILNFGSNEMYPKFTVLFHFQAQFTAGKPKILLKTKIPAKTTSLGISNNVSLMSQKKTLLVVLSKQKKFFLVGEGDGVQIRCKLPAGALSNGYQKFSHSL